VQSNAASTAQVRMLPSGRGLDRESELLWWLAYIALGLFSGFFAGMLGIGGGLVMVPR
jgi:hypothetical protein